ncbi:nucleoside/nucleotide kinase family protein [Palleronia sp. LCG004]|uniref:nucleoside/nucleotide kinase family protein n=1 Tax=Palleronia sp. LCG004 TaxID=3079304 RepID=UPI002941CFE3|nr:nucleoside/nucleotide kinase family protein [Palleronia sp. LCG004]WOI58144.1 nucleoside/nucleotide kinase family protein [Palleronia sp. LCG004]
MTTGPQDIPAALVERILTPGGASRRIVAVMGPPGSGKSTFAETLRDALADRGAQVAILPMDGFHHDDAILDARGLRARKGAPETFDVAGLVHLVGRLRRNDEGEIAVPVFDRRLEISRNAARLIDPGIDTLIVEGNYLLLDRPGWSALAPLFDLTIALDVPEAELRRRLIERWRGFAIPEAEIPARVDGNDMRNGLTVLGHSRAADITLQETGAAGYLIKEEDRQ